MTMIPARFKMLALCLTLFRDTTCDLKRRGMPQDAPHNQGAGSAVIQRTYLNDEEDNGVFGVVHGWIAALENTSLRSGTHCRRSRSRGFRDGLRDDLRHDRCNAGRGHDGGVLTRRPEAFYAGPNSSICDMAESKGNGRGNPGYFMK